MINFDNVAKETKKKSHNPNWPQIPYHPYRILIIRGSRSRKTNSLFNLITQQADIDKIYLNAKDQLTNEKVQNQSVLMILKLLMNTRIIWMIFTKILKNTIELKKL